MGVMRFVVQPEEMLDEWPEVHRAYISGLDGRVYPTRVELDGNIVECRRPSSESGKVHFTWPVPEFGRPVITTTSLREHDDPYVLAVELARGKICQIRDQLASWQIVGMKIPDEFFVPHKKAHQLFAKCVPMQDRPREASQLATEAITCAFQAAEILAGGYIQQRLAVRKRKTPTLPVLLGCELGQAEPQPEWADQICPAFTAAAASIDWKLIEPEEGNYKWELIDAQVEWCLENRVLVKGGPLLDLSEDGLPRWLAQWQHDFFNLKSFVCDFVETAISRYVGKIRTWEVASHANTGGMLGLNEENRLALLAGTLEVARQVDEEVHLLIRVIQPWGAYQSNGEHRLSPSQFVDALIRCGVGLSGVNLEFCVGFEPNRAMYRDVIDLSRLIDQWTILEVPLNVTLAFPSSADADDNAMSGLTVGDSNWKDSWSEESQAAWIDSIVPLLMAKQSVVGIYWSHLTDAAPHEFPNSGLIKADGTPKLALDQFVKTRHAHWD